MRLSDNDLVVCLLCIVRVAGLLRYMDQMRIAFAIKTLHLPGVHCLSVLGSNDAIPLSVCYTFLWGVSRICNFFDQRHQR